MTASGMKDLSDDLNWSIENCRSDQYRQEFSDVVRVLSEWLEPYGGFEGKNIFDFGCGEGTAALGIALQHQVRRIVAIDPNQKIWRCLPNAKEQLGLYRLPDSLRLFQIEPDANLSIFGTFDIVFSWSVFEHVQQDLIVDRMRALRRILKPDGIMFLQTTPLYYSARGSHLTAQIPQPWAHLSMEQDRLYAELRNRCTTFEQAYFLQTVIYETLNKATAPSLLRAAREAGFDILREYRTRDDESPPSELLEIFNEEILTTNQLVFLAAPTTAVTGG